MTQASIEASLRTVAAPFAAEAPGAGVVLRWGPLFAALAGDDDVYVEAIELIHEGYLVHYRGGRLAVIAESDRQTALLAGDVFYARGLRLIAARGDVGVPWRCSRVSCPPVLACARSRRRSPPTTRLWAYTMAALAAVRAGVARERAEMFFDEVDAALAEGAPADLPRRAAAARGRPRPAGPGAPRRRVRLARSPVPLR